MNGTAMSRDTRLDREAESLWRALSGEPPPQGLRGSELLSAALRLTPPSQYDRIHSPHLRASQVTRPR
jgi:hypothetical protein